MIFLKKRLSLLSSESRSDSESEFHYPTYTIENGEPTPRGMNQDCTGEQGSHLQSNLNDPTRIPQPKSKRRLQQALSFGGKKKTPLPNAELGLKRVGTDSNLLTTNKPSVFKKLHRSFKNFFSRSRLLDGSKSRSHTNGLSKGNGVEKSPLGTVNLDHNVLRKLVDQGLGTRSSNGEISLDRGQSDANTDPITNSISNLNGCYKESVREDFSESSDLSDDCLTILAHALIDEKDKNQQLSMKLETSQNQLNQSKETIKQLEAKNKALEHQSKALNDRNEDLLNLSEDLIKNYDSTRAENANFRAENANFRAENANFSAENANLNESYRTAVFSNSDLAKLLENSEAEKDKLTAENDKLTTEKNNLTAEKDRLTAEKDNLNDTISNLKDQNQIWMDQLSEKVVNEFNESIKSLETNGQNIFDQQNSADNDESAFIQLLGNGHIQEDEKEQQLEDPNGLSTDRDAIEYLTEYNNQLSNENDLLEEKCLRLNQRCQSYSEQNQALESELMTLKNQKEGHTTQLNTLQQEKELLAKQVNTFKQVNDDLATELNASQREKEGLTEQSTTLQQEKEGLAQQLNTLQQENKGLVDQLNDSKKEIGLHKRNKEKSKKLPKETRLKLRKQQNESNEGSELSENSLSQERKKEREERRRVHSKKVSSRLSNNPISPIQQPERSSSWSSNILKRLRFPPSPPSPSGADQSLKFRLGGFTSSDVSELKQLLSQITNVEVEKLFIEKMSEVFRKNFTSFKKPHSLFYYFLATYYKFKYETTFNKHYLDMIKMTLQHINDDSLSKYNMSVVIPSELSSLEELVKDHVVSEFELKDLFSRDKLVFLEKCVFVSRYIEQFNKSNSDAIVYLTRFDEEIYKSFAPDKQPFLERHLRIFNKEQNKLPNKV